MTVDYYIFKVRGISERVVMFRIIRSVIIYNSGVALRIIIGRSFVTSHYGKNAKDGKQAYE